MNTIKLFILFGLISSSLTAQSIENAVEKLSSDNLSAFAEFIDDKVSYSLDDKSEVLEKSAFVEKLATFLQKANPNKISLRHAGSDSLRTKDYLVAKARGDQNFRISLYMTHRQTGQKIKEIRITRV